MNRPTPAGARRAILAGAALATLFAAPVLAATTPAPAATNPPPASSEPDKGGGLNPMAIAGAKLDDTLSKIGASDDQKTRIKGIMLTAVGQIMALQPQVKSVPKALEQALTGPTVNRALLEQTRAQLIAALDQGSKALFNALADAAESLTPEQRVKLAALLAPKKAAEKQ